MTDKIAAILVLIALLILTGGFILLDYAYKAGIPEEQYVDVTNIFAMGLALFITITGFTLYRLLKPTYRFTAAVMELMFFWSLGNLSDEILRINDMASTDAEYYCAGIGLLIVGLELLKFSVKNTLLLIWSWIKKILHFVKSKLTVYLKRFYQWIMRRK